MQNQVIPNLHHFHIFSFNMYVFLHEEEQSLKSIKWEACARKGKYVRFDNHIIYQVHIEDQNKIIWVKNL